MNFRLLAASPWLAALATMILGATRFGATSDVAARLALDVVRVFAVAGCLAAATSFEPGERLRRAWSLHAACALLLFARDMTLVAVARGWHPPLGVAAATNVLVLSANVFAVTGTWLFARTWRIARIELPGSAVHRYVAVGLALVVGVGITGGALLGDLRAARGGDLQGLADFCTRVPDVIELCLIAPVVLTAVAMGAGVLRWPWGLFATSLVCWLFYDAAEVLGHLLGIAPAAIRIPREALRTLAVAYLGAAGFAQRLVTRPP